MKQHFTINKAEYGIKNYLNKHKIYKGNHDMHAVIINSFVVERGVSIDETWLYKLGFIQKHFGLFAQYAHNNWKKKGN